MSVPLVQIKDTASALSRQSTTHSNYYGLTSFYCFAFVVGRLVIVIDITPGILIDTVISVFSVCGDCSKLWRARFKALIAGNTAASIMESFTYPVPSVMVFPASRKKPKLPAVLLPAPVDKKRTPRRQNIFIHFLTISGQCVSSNGILAVGSRINVRRSSGVLHFSIRSGQSCLC